MYNKKVVQGGVVWRKEEEAAKQHVAADDKVSKRPLLTHSLSLQAHTHVNRCVEGEPRKGALHLVGLNKAVGSMCYL